MNANNNKVDVGTQVDFILYPQVKHLSEEEIGTSGLIQPISQFMKALLPMHETFELSASARNGILLYGVSFFGNSSFKAINHLLQRLRKH